LCLLIFTGLRARPQSALAPVDGCSPRVLILCVGLACYLVARFALFPAPLARYVIGSYVLAGILFARAIQSGAPLAGGAPARAAPPSPGTQ